MSSFSDSEKVICQSTQSVVLSLCISADIDLLISVLELPPVLIFESRHSTNWYVASDALTFKPIIGNAQSKL